MSKSMKTSDAGMPPELNARLSELQAQSRSPSREDVAERARALIDQVAGGELQLALEDGESAVGGGAGPTCSLPTTLIAITHPRMSAQEIERVLRSSFPPVISRISEGKVLLDLRTVLPDELAEVAAALKTID